MKKYRVVATIAFALLLCVGCINRDDGLTEMDSGLSVKIIPDKLSLSDSNASYIVRITNLSNEDTYTIEMSPYDLAYFNGNDCILIPRDELPVFLVPPQFVTLLPGESFEFGEQKLKTILEVYKDYVFEPGNYRLILNNEWYGEIVFTK